MTFFDTETTGLDVKSDKLVSVYCENKKKKWYLNALTNPEMIIPTDASNVHHITNDKVIDSPTNRSVLVSLVTIFDDTKVIAGYNIMKFDMPLVINLCSMYNINIDFKSYKYVDVYHLLKVVLTKEDLEQIGSLKLSNVFKYVTGKDLQNAHDAESDVKGCKKVLDWVLNNYEVDDCIYLNHEYLAGQPVGLDYKFYTGKHPEKTVSDLITQDPKYLKFLESKGLLILDSSITI